jgi:hypothetical protein
MVSCPYVYLAYLAVVLLLFVFRPRPKTLRAGGILGAAQDLSHLPLLFFACESQRMEFLKIP